MRTRKKCIVAIYKATTCMTDGGALYEFVQTICYRRQLSVEPARRIAQMNARFADRTKAREQYGWMACLTGDFIPARFIRTEVPIWDDGRLNPKR